MKKVYLSVLAGLTASIATAQYAPKAAVSADLITAKPKTTAEANSKAVGQTLWSDDFSTPANWVIDNAGQTAAQFGWNINSTSQGWYSTTGNGMSTTGGATSGGNNAELVNGNPTNNTPAPATNVVYTMTTANPIDITALGGTNNVNLEFKQFGARFNDLQEIQISLDGTTFVTVGDNSGFSVLSSTGGSAYPNPDTKRINLSSFLTTTTSVWIRFQWTTAYPSQASNPNVWVAYGWYIDDVKITTFADNDVQLTSSYWGTVGLNYNQIPLLQVQPIDFTANVFNGGTNEAKNVKLNIDVNTGAFTSSSTPVNIASLAADSLVALPFTPSTVGSYSVTRTITSDSTDDVASNNALSNLSFSVTDFVYARDTYVSGTSGTTNGTNGFEVGNLYDIFADQTMTAINTRLVSGTNATTAGTEIIAKVYTIDPTNGDFVWEGESAPLIVATSDMNKNLVMQFDPPLNLVAGTTYLAVVGTTGDNAGLKVANGGTSDIQTTFIKDLSDGTWYYQTGTPYVRMNFDPTVSLKDASTSVSVGQVYPNPVTGMATVNYAVANATDLTISVVDVTGKTVSSTAVTNVNGASSYSFDASAYTAGVYYVKIASADGLTTRKFIKK